MSNVDVLVRIIETRDRTISEKISETANRQTPVRTRDLRANDWIQQKLEEEFRTLGYYYERKKNQHMDQPLDKRLDAELIGQVALAFYHDKPSEARDQKSVVFGNLYSEIFNEQSVTAPQLLCPYLLYRPVEERKREIQGKKRRNQPVSDEEAFVSLATFHTLTAMKLIGEQQGLDLGMDQDVEIARSKAIQFIGQVVARERAARGQLYTHDRFFKQKKTNTLIRDHILKAYNV